MNNKTVNLQVYKWHYFIFGYVNNLTEPND